MHGNKRFWRIFLISVVFFGVAFFLIFDYSRHCKGFVEEQTYAALRVQAETVRNDFWRRVEEQFTLLDSYAEDMRKEEVPKDKISDFREEMSLLRSFAQLGIADAETGIAEFEEGNRVDVSNKKCYKNAISGVHSVDYFQEEGDDNGKLIFATPIYHENIITDVLIAVTNEDLTEKQIPIASYEGNGYVCVADQQGNILNFAHPYEPFDAQGNIFAYFSSKNVSMDEMKSNMSNGSFNSFSYSNEEGTCYTTYIPLGINDWYVFCFAPNTLAPAITAEFESMEMNFIFTMFCLFGAACIFIYFVIWKVAADIKKENECLKMAAEVAGVVSFEGDYQKDTFVISGNFFKQFGRMPIINKISDFGKPHPYILKEDQEVFLKMGQRLVLGKESADVQYRYFGEDGTIQWHQFVYRVWYDRYGFPKKCYGMIMPIDQQMKVISKLQTQVEMDPLTGVLNRTAFELYVNHCFKEELGEQSHALLLLDLDNFKQINDGYGHVLGDYALIKTSELLKACVRNSDYVGRLGGDEFVVFLRNVNKEQAAKKAGEICEALEKAEMKSNEAAVTCSIGIACFPRDGCDFKELYGLADRGLYKVKGSGKNSFYMVD
ncbi:MAG: sensor domain-containing diguanylate cyclase [Anaerotignum sp.]|nr:sensor domain-containing diguanylate cyclase [Anaerotignum sp.]